MIDSISGKRIVLLEHNEHGPYIRVLSFEDGNALEDLLDEYYIPYWIKKPPELLDLGGSEYYFGCAVDLVKLQAILDLIGVGC